jgi:heme-degrading monooxygenase HmoA
MHATVRSYSAGPELVDGLVERSDDVKRIISEIDGFQAYYMIRTAEGMVSVSVYDTEAGVDESTRVAADFIRENMPEFTAAPPRVSSGEVAIDA